MKYWIAGYVMTDNGWIASYVWGPFSKSTATSKLPAIQRRYAQIEQAFGAQFKIVTAGPFDYIWQIPATQEGWNE